MSQQILRSLIYYPKGPNGVVADLADLAANPYYSNIVLGQFHFSSTNGVLSWNDTPVSKVPSETWDAVRNLSAGAHPKVVSMQIGSGGNGTWGWIANNLSAAAQSLCSVITGEYGIGGIDLDPEPIGAVSLDTLFNFTLELGSHQKSAPFALSHVPVPGDGTYFPALYGPPYWAKMEPFLDWITPQWYGSTGASLVSVYKQFVGDQSLPPDRVVAGQEASEQSGSSVLNAMTSAIESLNKDYASNWGGIGIWAYPLPTSPDWSMAIDDALHKG